MLSILLYGRNDSHGYNLHKRAALSLNCIAAALSDPADEILFVDYNTPDELPTFPEAIADTLTDACKARLRIIRVRPDFHRQFSGKTRLVALESQSRNIAARRADPANRWLLSTNTDMIFCAREPGDTLSSVIGRLEDGFYHLPRFEVPEGFWERLDRLDPEGAVEAMRRNGRRFHINEIVWGIPDNLFEAPGDFQLFTREDLFAVEGFDERMLLGWHVDSNIAKRMRIFRGEVRHAFPALAGYHCGHTRQATSLHGGNRTQNDWELFIGSLEDPIARHQAGTWGAPDLDFEEIRLDAPDLYLPAMAAAVPAEGPEFSEVTYNDSSFRQINVDTDHALPHLCDLLFNFPPGRSIFFLGPDMRLLDGLRDFLEGAGRDPRFILTDEAGCPGPEALAGPRWAGTIRPLQQALAEADVLILQNPSGDMQPDEARVETEWRLQRVFDALTDMERARPASERRRIIVVNAIHTAITNRVEATLAPTVTPFSSRLRQGFVVQDAAPAAAAPQADDASAEAGVYARLGRTRPFSPQDRTLLERLFGALKAGRPPKGWERLAPEIAAIAASPAAAAQYGLPADEAAAWAKAADLAMRFNLGRAVVRPVQVGPRTTVCNRLLSGADWDDPAWGRLAVSYFGPDVLSFREMKRWVWERAALAMAVKQTLPAPAGEAPPKVLVLANGPEFLAAVLTHLGYDVACAAMDDFLAERVSPAWEPHLDLTSMLLHRPLRPHRPGEGGYAAFIATLPSLFEASRETFDAVLSKAHGLLAEGALFFATAPVQMNEIAYGGALSFAEWERLYEADGPLGARGFTPVGGVDAAVPLDAAARFSFQDEPGETVPALSYGFLRGFNTSAVLSAAWPAVLGQAPAGRLEHTAPRNFDPQAYVLPYHGGEPPAVDLAAFPAARAAAFHATRTLDRAGRDCLEHGPLLRPEPADANVLPFVRSLDQIERAPTHVVLKAPGGAGAILALDRLEAGEVAVGLDLPAGVEIVESRAVNLWGGEVPHSVRGGEVKIDVRGLNAPCALVLRFSAPEVELRRLTASAA